MVIRNIEGGVPEAPTGTVDRRLAYAAVVELAEEALVVAMAPDLLAVRDLKGRTGAIVVRPGDPGLAARLGKMLAVWQVGATSIVVQATEAEGQAFIDAAKPTFRKGRLFWSGVTQDGERWGETEKGPLADGLAAVLAPDATLDEAEFERRLRRSDERSREQRAFMEKLQSRRPIVTYALIAVNVAMFLLEFALGGADPTVRLLIRMGGIAPDLVRDGEVWRLISGAFLHGGLMHLGFNMFVLYILGRLAERILGPARYLLLYAACALAGSIASTFFMDAAVSVGASGALWGVLAAEAVFAFAPGFLPATMLPFARRTALINLGLNIAASFAPHIDWAAHFGGGLVGALLVYLVLARGLPRGEALSTEEPRSNMGFNIAAGLSALLLATGAIAGPILGGALTPQASTPTYERIAVETAGVSFEIPTGLEALEPVRNERAITLGFGDVMRDPALVAIIVVPVGPATDAEVEAEIDAGFEMLATAPEHATVSTPVRRIDDSSQRAAVAVSYRYESDLRQDVFIAFAGETLVRVETLYWPEADTYASGVARHVAESMERVPAGPR